MARCMSDIPHDMRLNAVEHHHGAVARLLQEIIITLRSQEGRIVTRVPDRTIVAGNPVRLNGVTVGNVLEVKLSPDPADRSVEVADEEGDVAQLGHPHDVSHQYKHRPGWAPP